MRYYPGLLFYFLALSCIGQLSESEIVQKIRSMQVTEDVFYDAGLFPVQRAWNSSSESVEDNSIFFTASIVLTLQECYARMDRKSKVHATELIGNAVKNYSRYRSRNGEPTYNFWQTVYPDLPFPNGNKWLSNPKMRLPDDLDTSILVAMTNDSDSLKGELRAKMVAYASRANRTDSKLNTLKKYQDSKAYEVWFAKDMPQTFDICVMTNVLYFILKEGYPINAYDKATIKLVKRMIREEDMMSNVDEISHHTTSHAVILYHVARLLTVDSNGYFEDIRPLVREQLRTAYLNSTSEMEKMLIATSFIRLNGYTTLEPDHDQLMGELSDFTFFSVKPFLGNARLSFLNHVVPDIKWTCEAYNWTLYLEYLVLKNTYSSSLSGTN